MSWGLGMGGLDPRAIRESRTIGIGGRRLLTLDGFCQTKEETMRTVQIHPLSLLAGVALSLFAFVSMGQKAVSGYQLSSDKRWPPHPEKIVTLDSTAHPSGSLEGGNPSTADSPPS